MACNSLAFAKAAVDLELPETLARLIDAQTAATILLAVLRDMFGKANLDGMSGNTVQVSSPKFTVTYGNGKIDVTERRSWYEEASDPQALAEILKETFRASAAFLLQVQVEQTLSQVGTVEKVEDFNGTKVYTLNV